MTNPAPSQVKLPPQPDQIGPYRIERLLGAGGMGTVYLGTHIETGRQAAVKMLPASMAHEEGFVARFAREIAAMEQLKSPHIVELYDSGEDHNTYYYAMEYVPGETLTDRLKREKRLPWKEAVQIGIQVCQALKSAHNCGIVHRDLKPSNLLIAPDGTVKLSDFGVAQMFATSKLTVTGGILGTAEYMSPEQAQGRRVTRQSDLYSLGAVMYVMLTGRPPFSGKSTLDVIQKHKFSQFDSPKRIVPEIPFWLDEVVCQCLEKKPEDRFPDAYVLMLRLKEIEKKLELKNSDDNEGTLSAEAATSADSESGLEHGMSGTLARDLFRIQTEASSASASFMRWFDNIWVLLGLLIVLIVSTAFLMQWVRMTPEKHFAKGEQIMQAPENPEWLAAREKHFVPLLEQDPEKWEPLVQPYMDRINVYEMKRKYLGRNGLREAPARSEPELQLRKILELRDQGLTIQAAEQLQALETLLQEQPEYASLIPFLQELHKSLIAHTPSTRLDYVNQALARAAALQSSGKLAEARGIWRSVITLYDSDPEARGLVESARRQLAESPSVSIENPAANKKE